MSEEIDQFQTLTTTTTEFKHLQENMYSLIYPTCTPKDDDVIIFINKEKNVRTLF